MSVTLSPSSTLGFARPLDKTVVKRSLNVTNPGREPVLFKVKTTAPRSYCVRPNSGRVEPGETVEVQVLLQPMKEDPPAGTKCRDKFLVQSVVITSELEGLGLPELWQSVERDDKARQAEGHPSQIHEQKIRCAYLPAADSDAVSAIPEETASRLSNQGSSTGGAADASFTSSIATPPSPSNPPGYSLTSATPSSPPAASYSDSSSTNPIAAKAQDAASAAGGAAASAAAAVGLPNLARVIDEKTPAPASSSSTSTAPAAAPTRGAETVENGGEVAQLRAELSSARAEITRLKQQLDAAETTAATLRSRGAGAGAGSNLGGEKGGAGAGTSQAVVEMKGSEGVPVQVVVGVAFGVFVVTWLFF